MVCRLWKEREGRSYIFTQLLRLPFNIMIPILLKAEKVNETGGKTTKAEENSALVGAALNSVQQAVLYAYLIVNVLSGRFAI